MRSPADCLLAAVFPVGSPFGSSVPPMPCSWPGGSPVPTATSWAPRPGPWLDSVEGKQSRGEKRDNQRRSPAPPTFRAASWVDTCHVYSSCWVVFPRRASALSGCTIAYLLPKPPACCPGSLYLSHWRTFCFLTNMCC